MKYVFGPVPSRRLGRSLGVDLVPLKACTFDCIYCQLGRTTDKTIARRDGLSVAEVLEEVRQRLPSRPDTITLSGSGEPTLSKHLGDVIKGIRSMTDIPVAVLTNGSLLWIPAVREALRSASIIIPSLDAGDAEMFEAVNRPHPDITFQRVVEGLVAMRQAFPGAYWLEVMLLAGHTAIEAEVSKIAGLVERIRPDRVQINTATRPPAEPYATAASDARLRRLARLIPGHVEIIAHRKIGPSDPAVRDGAEEILDLLLRRPCTMDDIQSALQIRHSEASKHLEVLTAKRLVTRRRAGGNIFYTAAKAAANGGTQP